MEKIPVITTQNYIVYIEHYGGEVWMHSDIFKWTSKIKKTYKKQTAALMDSFKKDVYAVNFDHGWKKRDKFMKLFGFHYFGAYDFDTTKNYHIYRRQYGRNSRSNNRGT
jgi:transcription elongation factor GreA-like protein